MTNEVTPLQLKKREGAADGTDTCWRVAIIASLTTFFTTATIKNSGIVFIGLIERFSLSRGQAAWPISIQEGAILTAGLLVHLLHQKMPIDQIGLLGTILTWSGLVASAFTPSVTWMSVTYGIVHGCGTGMMLVTLAILVLEYFQKYRGAATGIRYAGETFTAIVFPYVLLYLRRSFGFNGMLLLLGGIVMNSSALMLLLKIPNSSANKQDANRKPTPPWSGNIKDTSRYGTSKISNGNGTMPVNCEIEDRSELLVMIRKPIFYVIILSGVVGNYSENIFLTTIIDFATDSGVSLSTATSIILYTSATDLLGRLALPFFADKTSVKSKSLVLCCHVLLGLSMMLLPHHATSFPLLLFISLCIAMFIACVITMKSLLIADYFGYKKISVMYGLSGLVALPLFMANPRILGKFIKEIPERPDSGNVMSSEDSHSRTPIEAPTNAANTTDNPPGLRATLLNPIFYVIVISSATVHYSQVVFATTIVDYGKDKGAILVRATSIIVYSSGTDLIGRLVLPLLADRNFLRRSTLVMWCHLLLGLSMTLLPCVPSFAWLLLVSFCVTLFLACLLTMKVVLMADYLGLGQVPACYGAVGLVVLPLLLTAPRL
ncbi:unnamed protein product, partial [Ixodes pacificus]